MDYTLGIRINKKVVRPETTVDAATMKELLEDLARMGCARLFYVLREV